MAFTFTSMFRSIAHIPRWHLNSAISKCGFVSPNIRIRPISTTTALLAEPLKKKKKLDPAIARAREERTKRKLAKAIRKLERSEKQLKPIDECEVPLPVVENFRQRERRLPQLPTEVVNARWRIQKEWCRYRFDQVVAEVQMFHRMTRSQEKALAQLRLESEELYWAAVDTDSALIPYSAQGPVETAAFEDYHMPDGDYIDISKKWD